MQSSRLFLHYISRKVFNFASKRKSMKKIVSNVICGLALMMMGVYGCSSDESTQFHLRNFANTGCKSMTPTRGDTRNYVLRQESIEYKALGNGYLSLNHVNACYNCEPGELKMEATISGNEIRIVEEEQYAGANCICPYDLYCEVGPLDNGDYTIVFINGYDLSSAKHAEERFRFNISYNNSLNGQLNIREW